MVSDRHHLTEILVNLIGNALKFTERGEVMLSFDLVEGPALRIEVADTGIGLAPEARSRIFESFTQADETILDRFGGTGLGLSIVRGLSGMLGGTVSVDGEPGRGIAGRPQSAVTGGDGQDYVWLAGQVRRVSDGVVTERQARSFLYPTPAGAATAWLPTAADRFGEYRLTGSALEHFAAGQVVARVPHGAGRVGLVQGEVVTVSPAGELRRFAADLRPLLRLPAAGHSVLAAAPHVRVP